MTSFLAQYVAQSVAYSVIAGITAYVLIRVWRIESPRVRFRFYLLPLVLPVVLPLLFSLLYPQRNGLHFRDQVAVFDSGAWLSLALWGRFTLWHLFLGVLGLTAFLFVAAEAIPWVDRRALARALRPLPADHFPHLEPAVQRAARAMGRPVPQVMLAPQDNGAVYTIGVTHPVIAVSPRLLSTVDRPELTAMLCHETAHLLRRDHWTGWTLVALRSLAFYNPVAWFVSRLLWQENEKACDDIAAARTGDSVSLASALVKSADQPEAATRPPAGWRRWVSRHVESLEMRAENAQLAERVRRQLHVGGPDDAWSDARLYVFAAMLSSLLFFVV